MEIRIQDNKNPASYYWHYTSLQPLYLVDFTKILIKARHIVKSQYAQTNKYICFAIMSIPKHDD